MKPVLFPFGARLAEPQWGGLARKFQTLRAEAVWMMWSDDMIGSKSEGLIDSKALRMWMKYTVTRQMAIPHQGNRTLSSHGPSSPACHQAFIKGERQVEVLIRRIRDGFARAIENLRGMRMPLVQGPDAVERVLQAV
jgi:hypothetical protein